METEFRAGDKVRLREGGPIMIVSQINPRHRFTGLPQQDRVQCVWFDSGSQNQYQEFIKQSLRLVDQHYVQNRVLATGRDPGQ